MDGSCDQKCYYSKIILFDFYFSSDRFRLTTTSMGKVHLQLGIVQRNFDKFGIEC